MHHGTTNAVCMPAVLQFNHDTIAPQFDHVAAYLDIEGGFDRFCAYVDMLNDSLGIPKTLTGLGVADPDVERIVAGALKDPSTGGNPFEMTEENTARFCNSCCSALSRPAGSARRCLDRRRIDRFSPSR